MPVGIEVAAPTAAVHEADIMPGEADLCLTVAS